LVYKISMVLAWINIPRFILNNFNILKKKVLLILCMGGLGYFLVTDFLDVIGSYQFCVYEFVLNYCNYGQYRPDIQQEW
jgi:hypothetical protein